MLWILIVGLVDLEILVTMNVLCLGSRFQDPGLIRGVGPRKPTRRGFVEDLIRRNKVEVA